MNFKEVLNEIMEKVSGIVTVWKKPVVIFLLCSIGITLFNFYVKDYNSDYISEPLLDVLNFLLMGMTLLGFLWAGFYGYKKVNRKPRNTTKSCLILFTILYFIGVACKFFLLKEN